MDLRDFMQLRNNTKVKVAQSYPTLTQNTWAVARQSLLSIKFSRQAYWSGLQLPSTGNLPDPGIKPQPPKLLEDFFFHLSHQETHVTSKVQQVIKK